MARQRPSHLPNFTNPPVAETVLSVQFEPLGELRAAHLGLLWAGFRSEYPTAEQRPPLEPRVEEFPERPALAPAIRIQPVDSFPVPRLWFISKAGDSMLQVQPDRFIANWRKEPAGSSYPHYDDVIRPNFDRDFGTFREFVDANDLGPVHVNQCEVTYVNHIPAGQGWEGFGDVARLFTFWRPDPIETEDVRMHHRSVIRGDAGRIVGRLHIEIVPALRTADAQPMYVLNLTARGQIEDGTEFLDLGRESVVTAFERITTPEMHALWGKTHGSPS